MKYYCENCGLELGQNHCPPENMLPVWHDGYCPVCGMRMYRVPEYETVAQWEKRKGCKYPDTAPVWFISPLEANSAYGKQHWVLCEWAIFRNSPDIRFFHKDAWKIAIIATEAGEPPNNWRPE